jgi:Ca2+-binding EF-hand superfamily protein
VSSVVRAAVQKGAVRRVQAAAGTATSGIGERDLDLLGRISDVVYSNSKKLKAVFHEIDSDGSGSISAAELTRGLTRLGVLRLNAQDSAHLIEAFDAHGSGELSYSEFVRMLAATH